MYSRTTMSSDQSRWASGLNVLVGLWLLISPFVLGFSAPTGVPDLTYFMRIGPMKLGSSRRSRLRGSAFRRSSRWPEASWLICPRSAMAGKSIDRVA